MFRNLRRGENVVCYTLGGFQFSGVIRKLDPEYISLFYNEEIFDIKKDSIVAISKKEVKDLRTIIE